MLNSKLIALNSRIGWMIVGNSKGNSNDDYKAVQTMVSLNKVEEDVSKFWVVEEVHPGIDGLVRVVTVRGENGKTFKRPIVKLGHLPILE